MKLKTDGAGNLTWNPDDWALLTSTTTEQNMYIATTTVDAARDYRIIFSGAGFSSAVPFEVSFNNDRGSNYGWSFTTDGGVPTKGSNNAFIQLMTATTSPTFLDINIVGDASNRKLLTWQGSISSSGSISPKIINGAGVWNDTSSPITAFVFRIQDTGQTITAGTIIRVYGRR